MSEESEPLYEKLIYENVDKAYQLRLVVNEFRGKQYLHLRKYFLSFDEGFIPSREGVSMEATMGNMYTLLDGMLELCSKEENIQAMESYFNSKISDLKQQV